MQKFAFQRKIIRILYIKIIILPKFDRFYEKFHTLKTPLRSGDRPVPTPLRNRNYGTRNYWMRSALKFRLDIAEFPSL